MRRVLTHSALVLLVLAGTMGAAPGHGTLTSTKVAPVYSAPSLEKVDQPKSSAAYQVGKASWYGGFFNGRETANGEIYDMYDYTAAHRELPLGTFVRVTNLKNHKSVIVKINDRGPVVPGRIIDLSYSAARSIGMSEKGLQKVRLDIVKPANAEVAEVRAPANMR